MSETPFLSIVTRHLVTRPNMLKRNQEALLAQTDQDYEHLVFTDDVGRGCKWGQKWLVELIEKAKGRYIMVLDDDDLMSNPDGVRILKAATDTNPRGVIFRAYYGDGILLPLTFDNFRRFLWTIGEVGQLCYILRNDIFQQSRYVYNRGLDETDYLCLLDAYETAKWDDALGEFEFLSEIINSAQRRDSRGAPE